MGIYNHFKLDKQNTMQWKGNKYETNCQYHSQHMVKKKDEYNNTIWNISIIGKRGWFNSWQEAIKVKNVLHLTCESALILRNSILCILIPAYFNKEGCIRHWFLLNFPHIMQWTIFETIWNFSFFEVLWSHPYK